jgi:hypothetical protein
MLLDKQNLMSEAQAVTSTGSTVSTNVIDLGVARDIGGATHPSLELLCQVVTAFASGGSATMRAQLQTSPDNSAWTTVAQSDDVPVASLVAGYKFLANFVHGPTSRYVRMNYVVGTAAMTAGAVTAGFVPSLEVQTSYPRGYAA